MYAQHTSRIIQLSNYPIIQGRYWNFKSMSSDIAHKLITERHIMSIQYFIFEDNDDDQPYVFDAPIDNPMDTEDPEVGLMEYYNRVNQSGNYL